MIRQLRYREIDAFAAVMRTGSVVGASAQIGVSQPSVSRALQDLQAQLGYRLFERRGRGVVPTEAARALYAEVERSYLGLGRITAVARQIKSGFQGAITLGSNYAASFGLVNGALRELKDLMPDISVSLRIQTSATVIEWARIGFVDLAIVNLFGDFSDVRVLAERELDCVCVLPVGHPLLQTEGPVDLCQLVDETLILPDESTLSSLIPDAQLRTAIMGRGWLDVQIWYPVVAAVEEGLGVGIADPLSSAFFAGSRRVGFRSISERMPYRLALLCQAGSVPSGVAATLAEILANHMKAL